MVANSLAGEGSARISYELSDPSRRQRLPTSPKNAAPVASPTPANADQTVVDDAHRLLELAGIDFNVEDIEIADQTAPEPVAEAMETNGGAARAAAPANAAQSMIDAA